jgi:hypothetical protein
VLSKLSASVMLERVGLKKNTGGETTMLPFGLNAVEIIQATGKKKRIEIAQAPRVASFIGPDLRFGLKIVSAILNLCLLSSIQNVEIN